MKKNNCICVIFIFSYFYCFPSFATPVTQRAGLWMGYFLTNAHKPKSIRYSLQMESRFRSAASTLRSVLLRPAIGYQLNDATSVWLGYTAEPSVLRDKSLNYVDNIYEELSHRIGIFHETEILLRIRLEQRYSEDAPGEASRFRLRLGVRVPSGLKHIIYDINDEAFFNVNHPQWVSNKALSQNRIYIGIVYALPGNATLNIGYLNRIDFASFGTEVNHILFCSLTVRT